MTNSVHMKLSERGSSSVELALLAPLALVLLLTVLQGGLWFYTHSVCEHAAERGTEAARTVTGTAGHAEQAARTVTNHATGLATHPTVAAHVDADTVRVQVTAQAPRVLPIPGLNIPAHVTATAGKERFTTPGIP